MQPTDFSIMQFWIGNYWGYFFELFAGDVFALLFVSIDDMVTTPSFYPTIHLFFRTVIFQLFSSWFLTKIKYISFLIQFFSTYFFRFSTFFQTDFSKNPHFLSDTKISISKAFSLVLKNVAIFGSAQKKEQ